MQTKKNFFCDCEFCLPCKYQQKVCKNKKYKNTKRKKSKKKSEKKQNKAKQNTLTGACCGPSQTYNVDDVAYTRGILNDLEINHNFNIDRNRVYATGHSNGAGMTWRLACEASDIITAAAPNDGKPWFVNATGCDQQCSYKTTSYTQLLAFFFVFFFSLFPIFLCFCHFLAHHCATKKKSFFFFTKS